LGDLVAQLFAAAVGVAELGGSGLMLLAQLGERGLPAVIRVALARQPRAGLGPRGARRGSLGLQLRKPRQGFGLSRFWRRAAALEELACMTALGVSRAQIVQFAPVSRQSIALGGKSGRRGLGASMDLGKRGAHAFTAGRELGQASLRLFEPRALFE